MRPINGNINLMHSAFISFYEFCQPLKFVYKVQLVHSFLLSFTEYLYNMKGNVMTSMEKCNVCILLQQCLNENIYYPNVARGQFFHWFPFVSLFIWQQVIKRSLEVSRNRAVTHARQKSIKKKKKNTTTLRRKEKQEKFITTK